MESSVLGLLSQTHHLPSITHSVLIDIFLFPIALFIVLFGSNLKVKKFNNKVD